MHPKSKVKVVLAPGAVLPAHQSFLASGVDLHAYASYEIPPKQTVLVKTGVHMQCEPGFEIQVRPRSGLSLKTPLRVANAPGTVDADYTGDCSVILWNSSDTETVYIAAGDRIAQAVLVPVYQMDVEIVSQLDAYGRGSSGFGSTGSK